MEEPIPRHHDGQACPAELVQHSHPTDRPIVMRPVRPKSYDHTWCPYKGLRRMQDPSVSRVRDRLGWIFGTFSPSCFQILKFFSEVEEGG